jgi:hypothetical protein
LQIQERVRDLDSSTWASTGNCAAVLVGLRVRDVRHADADAVAALALVIR